MFSYTFLLYLLLTYLISSIPFGLIICKMFKNIDIREHGSKNIGATNVARTIGAGYGYLVFVLDGLKSLIPVLISNLFYKKEEVAVVLFIAVMGHIFSFWLKGKGGKGIASTVWGLLGLNYYLTIIMLLTWIIVFKKTKISSLSALASIVAVVASSFFLNNACIFYVLLILGIVIFWAHRKNIKRLISGEELGFKKNDK